MTSFTTGIGNKTSLTQQSFKGAGFTLIEMLIVMAVIGILASVTLIILAGTRDRARDSRRIGDLKNVQNGLELFFNVCGHYPDTNDWGTLADYLINPSHDPSCPGVLGIGVTQVPNDPGSGSYFYGTNANGSRYVIGAELEQYNVALDDDPDGVQIDIGGVDCGIAGPDDRIFCKTI